MRRQSLSQKSATAPLVYRSLRHPFLEKLHFYLFNVFRNLGPARGLAQFGSFVIEKKVHPLFNQYVLSRRRFPAEPERGLLVVQHASLEEIPIPDLETFYREATCLTFSWLQSSLESGGRFWLGYLDGKLTAYCCTRDYPTSPAPGSRDAYLFAVEVLARFRGRRLSVSFLRQVCGALFAGSVESVWSETHAFNKPSNRMHRRLGFEFRQKIRG